LQCSKIQTPYLPHDLLVYPTSSLSRCLTAPVAGQQKWETKIAETRIWRTDIQGTDTGTSKGTTQIAGGNGALTVGVRAKGAFDGSVGGK
jgi:hypothetical protein